MDKLDVLDDSKIMSIQVKLYLARVLRRLGELEEAKKHCVSMVFPYCFDDKS